LCFSDKSQKGKKDWWQVLGGINGFKTVVQASNIRVLDEIVSSYYPRTMRTGSLPYFSITMRKPEPLGTEFKTLAAAALGMFPMKFKKMID